VSVSIVVVVIQVSMLIIHEKLYFWGTIKTRMEFLKEPWMPESLSGFCGLIVGSAAVYACGCSLS